MLRALERLRSAMVLIAEEPFCYFGGVLSISRAASFCSIPFVVKCWFFKPIPNYCQLPHTVLFSLNFSFLSRPIQGLVGAPACGDVMKLQIKVDDDGNIVESVFKTFGCGSAIAASSVATEWVKGKSVDEVLAIKNSDIAAHLKLPPVKLHCSMLAEDAIKAAVKDWKGKQEEENKKQTAAWENAGANAWWRFRQFVVFILGFTTVQSLKYVFLWHKILQLAMS